MYLLYFPFSRNPDFFDGKYTTAIIQKNAKETKAVFTLNGKDSFYFNPEYIFKTLENNQNIKTIYATSNPSNASQYSFWGYWLTWKDLVYLPLGYLILFLIAKAIISNQSLESIKEFEEESKKPKIRKPRYDV